MKTYNWEGVKPDGYFLDKLEPIPSGLTPSQLYVFMPPNLGGFFMVRSYYPSECHADYFDFERIEALKPAIEACGISTLSQSPMRSEERFSRNAETDLVCRLLLEKKNAPVGRSSRRYLPVIASPFDVSIR